VCVASGIRLFDYLESRSALAERDRIFFEIWEKQIKSGSRDKKVKLIYSINKSWKDLAEELLFF